MPNSFNTIFCSLFIIIGLTLIIGNLAFGYQTLQFIKNASSAKGKVTELNSGQFHPQVAFTTQDGKQIQYPQNGLIKGYSVGEEVAVLYEPQNPQNACVDTFGALWGGYIFFFILGIVFIVIGTFKLLKPNSKWIYWNK